MENNRKDLIVWEPIKIITYEQVLNWITKNDIRATLTLVARCFNIIRIDPSDDYISIPT